jgi:low affinity Fe/Cu permease
MRMDSKRIEELLQKYWDCETSLEEEQQLHEYFRNEHVPEKLKETAGLFHYFGQQKGKSVNEQFDKTVLGQLKKPQGRVTNLVQTSLKIAAGVAVLLAAVFFVRQEIRKNDTVAMEDTFDDPQKALEETKKALLMISKGFGRAEQQAKKINLINEAQDKIQTKTEEKTEL